MTNSLRLKAASTFAVFAIFVTAGAPLRAASSPTTTAPAAATATLPVGMTIRPYFDPARPSWDHAGPRPLKTVVWYPAPVGTNIGAPPFTGKTAIYFGDPGGAPYFKPIPVAFDAPLAPGARRPLILLSHGSTGLGLSLEWLATALASHGYIVAAVNHHGNTIAEGTLLTQGFALPWERADDLSAVLTALLHDPVIGPAIDPTRVGAAGHSAGGETVLAVAGGRFNRARLIAYCASAASRGDGTCEPREAIRRSIADIAAMAKSDPVVQASLLRARRSHRDPRIRAVFAMAPAMGPAFGHADLASIHVPVEIVVGDADETTPSKTNAGHFAELIRGAKLWVLPQVDHLTFSSECTPLGKEKLGSPCSDRAGLDRGAVQRSVAEKAYAFFQSELYLPPPLKRK